MKSKETQLHQKITQIFNRFDFKLIENNNGVLKYNLNGLVVKLIHDKRENSNKLILGDEYVGEIEIDNDLLNSYFKTDIKLENLDRETFINNVCDFLNEFIFLILKNQTSILNDLKAQLIDKSRRYTDDLISEQEFTKAISLWEKKDYANFIKVVDKIDDSKVSKSLMLKYQYAVKKLDQGG